MAETVTFGYGGEEFTRQELEDFIGKENADTVLRVRKAQKDRKQAEQLNQTESAEQ